MKIVVVVIRENNLYGQQLKQDVAFVTNGVSYVWNAKLTE